MAGAVIGASLFSRLGTTALAGFRLYSLFASIAGAIVALAIHHALFAGRLGTPSGSDDAS
jgi:uncharacterized membrane protein YeaQ/YmgE (transglycosylase-associated protein family)